MAKPDISGTPPQPPAQASAGIRAHAASGGLAIAAIAIAAIRPSAPSAWLPLAIAMGAVAASLVFACRAVARARRDLKREQERTEGALATAAQRTDQFARLHGVFMALSRLDHGDFDNAARTLVTSLGTVLQAFRTSLWLLDEPRTSLVGTMSCRLDTGEFEHGQRLPAVTCPRYFAALQRHRLVEAEQAASDPRTSELAAIWLRPLGITSVLACGLWHNQTLIGAVTADHVGPVRRWSAEEKGFVTALADLATSVVVAARSRRAREAGKPTDCAADVLGAELAHVQVELQASLREAEQLAAEARAAQEAAGGRSGGPGSAPSRAARTGGSARLGQ